MRCPTAPTGHDGAVLVEVIGDLLPAAVAVALSPIPVIAVVVMLGTPLARRNGPAFALGWVVGLVAVSTVVLVVAGGSSDPDSAASTGVDWVQVGAGVLFLVMALRQWRKRPAAGEEAEMPSWMEAVDHFTPVRSLVLGLALSAANPKNLVLTLAAASVIAQAGLPAGEDVVAVAVFVVLASVTVVGAVVAYLVAPEPAGRLLGSVKDFMAAHNTAIMVVILLLLGLKLLGEGLGAVA